MDSHLLCVGDVVLLRYLYPGDHACYHLPWTQQAVQVAAKTCGICASAL